MLTVYAGVEFQAQSRADGRRELSRHGVVDATLHRSHRGEDHIVGVEVCCRTGHFVGAEFAGIAGEVRTGSHISGYITDHPDACLVFGRCFHPRNVIGVGFGAVACRCGAFGAATHRLAVDAELIETTLAIYDGGKTQFGRDFTIHQELCLVVFRVVDQVDPGAERCALRQVDYDTFVDIGLVGAFGDQHIVESLDILAECHIGGGSNGGNTGLDSTYDITGSPAYQAIILTASYVRHAEGGSLFARLGDDHVGDVAQDQLPGIGSRTGVVV